jgi:hypothetical protein
VNDQIAEDRFYNSQSRHRHSVGFSMHADRSIRQDVQMLDNDPLGHGADPKCKHCGKGQYEMISNDEEDVSEDQAQDTQTSEDTPPSAQAKRHSQHDDATDSVA